MTGHEADAADTVQLPGLRIVGGSPTPEELAAVTAVLTTALEAAVGEQRRSQSGPTAWQRSQRPIRRPLTPGTWAGFGA